MYIYKVKEREGSEGRGKKERRGGRGTFPGKGMERRVEWEGEGRGGRRRGEIKDLPQIFPQLLKIFPNKQHKLKYPPVAFFGDTTIKHLRRFILGFLPLLSRPFLLPFPSLSNINNSSLYSSTPEPNTHLTGGKRSRESAKAPNPTVFPPAPTTSSSPSSRHRVLLQGPCRVTSVEAVS